jgi:hypothetical protein
MFIFILVGLWGISAYVCINFLTESNLLLAYAVMLLSWGVILAIMYLVFKYQDWAWWD